MPASASATETMMPAAITGQDLIQLRKRLGLSQAELAGELKVSPNTVYRWERDVHTALQPLAYWALVGLLVDDRGLTENLL